MTTASSAISTPTRACARLSPCFMNASRTFRRCTTSPRASESLRWRAVGEVTPSVSQFETPHTATPKTQLLSNGRYGLMLTNAGGGYSRWGDFEITRWRSDPTRDSWGTFCYIHDADSDRLWCNTYQPTGGKVEQYLRQLHAGPCRVPARR